MKANTTNLPSSTKRFIDQVPPNVDHGRGGGVVSHMADLAAYCAVLVLSLSS